MGKQTTISVIELEEAQEIAPFQPTAPVTTVVSFNLERDERDQIEPIEGSEESTESGVLYQRMNPTRWILPRRGDREPIFPAEGIVRELIYTTNGNLTVILEQMGWNDVSKGELMRWINKLGLTSDIILARDTMVDKAEKIINTVLDEGCDVETAKFVVKTVGKKRGWSERPSEETTPGNVYNFINLVGSGGEFGSSSVQDMTDASLVKYLEDQIKQR
jgi:hypothetical protein